MNGPDVFRPGAAAATDDGCAEIGPVLRHVSIALWLSMPPSPAIVAEPGLREDAAGQTHLPDGNPHGADL